MFSLSVNQRLALLWGKTALDKTAQEARVVVQLPLPIRKGFIGLARCAVW